MRPWQKDPILKVEHLSMRFGGLTAVDDVSFEAGRREITALIGPNGAGKTTVFNCITGFYEPTVGTIILRQPDGEHFRLERLDDHEINWRAKVARTFQNIRLFPGMTALENLMVAQAILGAGIYGAPDEDATAKKETAAAQPGSSISPTERSDSLPYTEPAP